MSTTIDQRVVEMRFDNRHFENNVQTTMSTLEKLKQKLNFSGASKGLDNLSSAAKNVKLDSLGSAVETVSAKFSAMDVIGVTALANITNQAVNAGKRIVSALTIDPIKTGLSEYETKINAIQVIQANTRGKNTMEDITTALEDLNRYADNTIYNFAQMTSNIGKFTAQGFDVYSAADAVKGMANLAAASGASAEDMARATYQMSQALGGTVKLMDWNSLRNANMATIELKNTLMDLARVQGIDIDSMIENKGTFEQTLQDGWLTGEMFSQAMNIYSGVYEDAELAAMGFTEEQIANFQDLAATAESAATEVKTFTQLWDVLKETAQSGWTRTWELLIGDFDTAKSMLTGLQIYFSDIINGFSDFRNGILERALGSPFGKLAEKIANVTGATEEMVDATKDYTEIVDKVINGEYGNGQSRWDKLAEEGYDWAKVQNMVNEKLGSSKRYTEELGEAQGDLQKTQVKTIDQLVKMSDAQLKEIGFTNSEIEAFRELEKQAELTGIPLEDILEDTSLLSGRSLMINGLQNAWSGLASAVGAVRDAFRETFFGDASTEEIMDSIASKVYNAIAAFHNFSTHLVMSDETVDKLKRTFKGLFAIVDIVSTLFGGAFKIGLKLVNAILGKFDLHILDVTAIVGDAIVGFRDFLYTILDFDAAAEWAINTFNNLKATVMSFVDKMKATPEIGEAWDNVVEKFVTVADTFKKLWNFIKKAITGGFEGTGVDIWDGLVFGLKHGAKAVWDAIASVARAVIETFKSILGIHSPSTVMIALGGFIIAGLVIGLTKFGPKIWEVIKGIGSKISEYFGDMDISGSFIDTIKTTFDELKSYLSTVDWEKVFAAVASTGIFLLAKKILDIFNNFSAPFGALGDLLSNVADITEDIAKPIGKVITGFAKLEKSLARNINSKAIKNMVISLLILVGAVVALTFIDTKKLWNAVGVILALSVILGGLMIAMSAMSDTSAKWKKGEGLSFDGLKTGLIQIGAALLLLAIVVKLVGSMNPEQAIQGFAGLIGLAIILGLFMAAMVMLNKKGSSKDIDKVGSMIFKLSIAMLLMVGVCKLASKLSAEEMLQGAAFATVFMIFTMMITKVAKSAGNNVGKVGGMLIKLSIAMLLMVGVCKLASKLSAEEMLKGAAFAAAFVIFVKALISTTKIGGKQKLAKLGGMLLGMSLSLVLMVGVCKLAGTLTLGEVLAGGACIIAFGLMIKALVGILKIGNEEQMGKVAGTVLAMSLAIAIMAGTAVVLSLIDTAGLAKGVVAVGILALVMKEMIKATKGANNVTGSIVAMSVAIAVMAGAVALLSFIDPASLITATLCMSLLMGMFAVIAKSAGTMGKVMAPLIVMTVAIGVLAGVLYLLSGLPVESSIGNAMALSILMLAMSVSMLIVSKVGTTATKALIPLAGMVIVMGLIGVVLGLLQHFNVQPSIETAVALSILLLGMSAACLILAGVGAVAGYAIAGAAGLVGVIAVIGLFIGAIGYLSDKFPQLESFLDSGIPLLEKIGYGIGSFISSIGEGLTSGLPDMGKNIADFMGKLSEAATNASGIDASSFDGVSALIGVLGEIGLNTVGTTISDIFTLGGTSMEKFEEDGKAFFKAMKTISSEATGISMDEDTMTSVTTIASGLIDLMNSLPNTGGLAQAITGIKDLGLFGTDVSTFITELKTVNDALGSDYTFNEDAFTAFSTVGTKFSDLMNGLPNTGQADWITKLTGVKSLGTFGTDINTFMNEIKLVNDALGSDYTFNEAAFTAVSGIGTSFSTLMESIPSTGYADWITKISGVKSLGTFGLDIGQYVLEMKLVNDAIGADYAFNQGAFDAVAGIGTSFSTLVESIPASDGLLQILTGVKKLGTFGTDVSTYVTELKTVNDALGSDYTFHTTTFESVAGIGTTFTTLVESIPTTDGILQKITGVKKLGTFGSDVSTYINELKTINDTIGSDYTFNTTAFGAVKSAGDDFVALIESLPEEGFFSTKITMDDFSGYINSFCTTITDFSTSAAGIDTSGISASILAAYQIEGLIDAVADIDTSGIAAFTGVGTGGMGADGAVSDIADAMVDFSSKVSGIDTDAVSTATTAALKLKNLITGIVDIDTSGIEPFKKITEIGSTINSYADNVGDIDTSVVSSSITSANRLRSFINSLADLDSSGINNFKVGSIGSTIASYASSVSGVDTGAIAVSLEAAKDMKKFISSLAGLDSSGVGSFTEAIAELGTVSLETVAKAFSGDISKLKTVGTDIVDAIAGGFKAKQKDLVHMVTTAISDVIKKIDTTKAIFKVRGIETMSQFINGMNSQKTRLVTTMSNAASSGANAARNYWSSFYSAGSWLVSGFVSGISANTWRAEAQAKAMANAAEKAAKEALNINSPSKVFAAIGSGVVEGFVKGIDDNMGDTDRTIATMADLAREGFSTAMKGIDSMLNSDMDMQPTITPVLDLSNVQSGVGSISSMLGLGSSIGLNANVGAVSSMMSSRNQNGSESEVVSAINKLGKSLGNLGNTTYNVNGVSANDDAAVVDAVKTIIRAARIERRV